MLAATIRNTSGTRYSDCTKIIPDMEFTSKPSHGVTARIVALIIPLRPPSRMLQAVAAASSGMKYRPRVENSHKPRHGTSVRVTTQARSTPITNGTSVWPTANCRVLPMMSLDFSNVAR